MTSSSGWVSLENKEEILNSKLIFYCLIKVEKLNDLIKLNLIPFSALRSKRKAKVLKATKPFGFKIGTKASELTTLDDDQDGKRYTEWMVVNVFVIVCVCRCVSDGSKSIVEKERERERESKTWSSLEIASEKLTKKKMNTKWKGEKDDHFGWRNSFYRPVWNHLQMTKIKPKNLRLKYMERENFASRHRPDQLKTSVILRRSNIKVEIIKPLLWRHMEE